MLLQFMNKALFALSSCYTSLLCCFFFTACIVEMMLVVATYSGLTCALCRLWVGYREERRPVFDLYMRI